MPCAIIMSAMLDQFLVTVYMRWAHPWIGIFKDTPDPNTDPEEANGADPGNLQNAIQEMIPLVTLNLGQDETNEGDNVSEQEM